MTRIHVPDAHRLHPGYAHPVLRRWQSGPDVDPSQLVYPIFVVDDSDARQEINGMPGQYRWGVNRLEEALSSAVADGLRSVLLFGVPSGDKDAAASHADGPDSPVISALRRLRELFPDLYLITDICLCAYTDHGHCCLFGEHGRMDNEATIQRLAGIAVSYAGAGANMVAPSDMMDGRIRSIKQGLREAALGDTPVMSYSAKFASCFYGPFREAAHSIPTFGDRHAYQLPVAARGLALRAIDRDIAEGADFVMVKPAGPYLDIIREARNRVHVPVACYQVSGECAMIHHAAAAGSFELRAAVHESIDAFRRAGADVFITYFAPDLLRWKR